MNPDISLRLYDKEREILSAPGPTFKAQQAKEESNRDGQQSQDKEKATLLSSLSCSSCLNLSLIY
jgi:hypothetical protein